MAIFGKRVLLHLGCLYNYKLAGKLELYKKILNKLGVKYLVLKEEICSGAELYNLGYETEARKLARKNLNIFKKTKIDKIITLSPEAYKFFLNNYREILPDWEEIEIEHISVTILKELLGREKLIKNPKLGEQIVYHNDCWLKVCKLEKELKELLNLLGYESIELEKVCGAELSIINPKLAEKITLNFFKYFEKTGIDKIITLGSCCHHLNKFKPDNAKILELGEAVAYGLGLINKEDE